MMSEAFHRGKYYVTFKRGFEDNKKDVTVTVYRIFEYDSLRIELSDEADPTFLCVLNVTRTDYEDLKKQQGLLIDFENFPSQLVRLLQQSSMNNMFLNLQQSNPLVFYFEVVEHNDFKRLVHLSLKTGPATDSDIKRHMAENILNLKKTLSSVKSTLSNSETTWSNKYMAMEQKLHNLTINVSKMEEEKQRKEAEYQELLKKENERLSQERLQWQKTNEINTKSQLSAMQENISRKDKQINELNTVIKQQKDIVTQLEAQLNDKGIKVNMSEKESQKLQTELLIANTKNSNLERDVMEKEKQCHQLYLKNNELEKTVREHLNEIHDLNNTIRSLTKEKTCLEERLAISESLVNKNNTAAHTTSEQLLKANQIIAKQNNELIETKDKLLCRTAIALEQEKVIEKNSIEIERLNSEVMEKKNIIESLKSEIETLKERFDANEKCIKDKDEIIKNNNMVIQWLHKKMEDNCLVPESQSRQRMTASSTPYFLPNKNNSDTLHTLSDESINFYGTSKSVSEDSPGPQVSKKGLDPKYLQPASDDRTTKSSNRKENTKKAVEKNRFTDKENLNINLPKVDYREKKTARSATYRSTPVSAYFP